MFASPLATGEVNSSTSQSSNPAPRTISRCFHCGELCKTEDRVQGEKHFCCVGCETVFAILTESGLGQFYQLARTPGSRVSRPSEPQTYTYLDQPEVQERLIDFADERSTRITFHIPAIHCVACVWLLENLFRLREGIGESRVQFSRREVSITFRKDQIRLSELVAFLAALGYEPELQSSELDRKEKPPQNRWRQRQWLQLGIAGFGFGNIMLMALPNYLGLDSLSGPWFHTLAGRLSLILAFPVLTYSALDYWKAAWISVRQKLLTLDVPIALGLIAIYAESLLEILGGRGDGYCDSLTGLIFFLLCGRLFQRKTFDRLAFDRDYKGFFPLAVMRRTPTGEESIAISQLSVGDRLLIRHGELIPSDSDLISGEGLIDYSFVTGESAPVVKRAGEHVYAGGRQMGGAIEVQSTKAVSESYLTSLWNNEAFRKSADRSLQTQTNRYSKRFTRVILAVAFLSAIGWLWVDPGMSLKAFTSVLIVACPCALALAAPLTLGAAMRLLGDRHIFLRNAEVVEHLAEVDTVVLDKTGTLTSTHESAVTWHGAPLAKEELLRVAALASQSGHPLAARIAALAGTSKTPHRLEQFREVAGSGIEGDVDGQPILLGSRAWLVSHGVDVPSLTSGSADLQTPNGNGVHVALEKTYRGNFALEHALRPAVTAMASALSAEYRLALLSGDQPREAAKFQSLLGPDAQVAFNQTPFDKLRSIGALQERGAKVLMVGDGLNDAGALKQANVGVAVVEKVGTFSPSSDVILDASELYRLPSALRFSKQAARVVRYGFVLSGLYNVVGISIAATGKLSPLVCAILMPLSSISVVLFAISTTRLLARRTLRDVKAPTTSDTL